MEESPFGGRAVVLVGATGAVGMALDAALARQGAETVRATTAGEIAAVAVRRPRIAAVIFCGEPAFAMQDAARAAVGDSGAVAIVSGDRRAALPGVTMIRWPAAASPRRAARRVLRRIAAARRPDRATDGGAVRSGVAGVVQAVRSALRPGTAPSHPFRDAHRNG